MIWRGGWNKISSRAILVSPGRERRWLPSTRLNPSRWPNGEQISVNWIEVNEAYHDFEEAYQNTPDEDRVYLGAKTPEP